MADIAKIKQRLKKFRRKALECKSMKEEVRYMEESYGDLSSMTFDAMPKGSPSGVSPQERQVIRKLELEERIVKREAELNAEWHEEMEPFVEQIEPMNALVIRLRYFYGAEWPDITRQVYGKRKEYETEQENYLNKIFKRHGRAILELAKIFSVKK